MTNNAMPNNNNIEQYLDAEGNLVIPRGETITWRSNGQEHTLAAPDNDTQQVLRIPMELITALMDNAPEEGATHNVEVNVPEEEEDDNRPYTTEVNRRMRLFNHYVDKKLSLVKAKECLSSVNLIKLKKDYRSVLRGEATGCAKELLATCKQIDALTKTLRCELIMLCALKFYKTDFALKLYEKQKEQLQKYIELSEEYCHTTNSSNMCLQKEEGVFVEGEAAYLAQCEEAKIFYEHCAEHWRRYKYSQNERLMERVGQSIATDDEWEQWVDKNTTYCSEAMVEQCITQVRDAYMANGMEW